MFILPYLFAALIFAHGVIHLMVFGKNIGEDNSTGSVKPVPGHQGWLWLLAGLLLNLTAILIVLPGRHWPLPAFIAALFSQLLIIINWKRAKWATVVNVIILGSLLFVLMSKTA